MLYVVAVVNDVAVGVVVAIVVVVGCRLLIVGGWLWINRRWLLVVC